jgi:predicted RNA methylase
VTFLEELLAVPALERDAWVNRRLGFPEPPSHDERLPKEGSPYFPAAVEEIVTMVQELPLRAEHAFVDLGSGLGRVVILAHLLSGARALGIEVQPNLVELSRARAAALALPQVSFVEADATEHPLDGDVFFLYAPAYGELRARLVKRLEAVAKRRAISVCSVAVDLRGESWLEPRRTSCETLTLYRSR